MIALKHFVFGTAKIAPALLLFPRMQFGQLFLFSLFYPQNVIFLHPIENDELGNEEDVA